MQRSRVACHNLRWTLQQKMGDDQSRGFMAFTLDLQGLMTCRLLHLCISCTCNACTQLFARQQTGCCKLIRLCIYGLEILRKLGGLMLQSKQDCAQRQNAFLKGRGLSGLPFSCSKRGLGRLTRVIGSEQDNALKHLAVNHIQSPGRKGN